MASLVGVALIIVGVAIVAAGPFRAGLSDAQAWERSDALSKSLLEEWASTDVDPVDLDRPGMSRPLGKGFAFLYIPRLGKEWRSVIVEGVDQPDLEGAVGHFPESPGPGLVGNFALAGHRNMDGSFFGNLDEAVEGDNIIVETRDRWYVYRVTGSKIILPSQVDVLAPVPFQPGKEPKKAVITLTTCHPWWSDAQRLAVFGVLEETRLKTMGPPDALPNRALTAE